MSTRKRLLGNMLSLGAVQVFSYLLPFLSLPYLARVLGPTDLGRMAFAISVAQIFVILTDYGFNLSGPKAVALVRENKDQVTDIWCAVTFLRAVFAILGLVLIATLLPLLGRMHASWDLILIAYLLVIGNVLFPQWLFQGLEQLRFVSIAQIGARLAVFIATFALVRRREDLLLATALQALGPLLGGLLALPHTLKALSLPKIGWPQPAALRHQLHEGWHVFLSSAAINVYTTCNAFFLGLLAPPSAVGHYHVAEKLIRAVQMILSPISGAVYPHVSRLAAEDPEAMIRFNRKLLIAMTAGGTAFTALVLLLAPWGVSLLFGPGYEEASLLLRVMGCLPLLVAISNVLGMQTMLPLGMKQAFSRILLASAILDILLFLPAASLAGALGAAWTNVLIELLVTVAMTFILMRVGAFPLQRINPAK